MTGSGGAPPDDRDRRARAEAVLHSGEPSYRLIVDTIPGLIATMTTEGEVEHVNRQVLEYFGRTLDQLKQWGTSDAVHPDDRPAVIETWRHAVATGLPYEIEHRMRRADGVYRWFQLRGVPLCDDEGRIVRWYANDIRGPATFASCRTLSSDRSSSAVGANFRSMKCGSRVRRRPGLALQDP